jgi:hypothetical protein
MRQWALFLDTVMRGIMVAASIEDSLSSALGWPPLRRLSVGCSSHKSPQAGFGSAQTGAKPGPSVSLSRRWSDATARIGRYRSGRRTLLQLEAGSNPPIKTDLGAAPRVSAQIGSCSEKFRTPLDALDELRVPEKIGQPSQITVAIATAAQYRRGAPAPEPRLAEANLQSRYGFSDCL